MSNQNKLLIAAAGAGKTTFLVREALKIKNESVLITTYTEANEAEIKKKIIKENLEGKFVPSNITILTWFTFLLKHGVKPYQGAANDILFEKNINGMSFVKEQSGYWYTNKSGIRICYGEDEFEKYYFNPELKIYSDKISKFVFRCNTKSNGNLLDRLSRIYSHIFIDEVQDLAGYDLEILKLLFKSNISTLLVGDPRQVTYLTHHERKHTAYKDGNIKEFVNDKCKSLSCLIDETTLRKSHRNNLEICNFSSRLFPNLPLSEPCNCSNCRKYVTDHKGIYVIHEPQVNKYRHQYSPAVLRYEDSISPEWNFGKSKGLTFDRVLIYPTKTIIQYLNDGKLTKTVNGKIKKSFDITKFYVALTRARYSVAIVYDYNDVEVFIEGIQKWIDIDI
jgi:DNA helicase II / ATP-dependent DNA helicase PcrA